MQNFYLFLSLAEEENIAAAQAFVRKKEAALAEYLCAVEMEGYKTEGCDCTGSR